VEVLLLSLFLAGLPALFLFADPGLGQLFLVFFGAVPGAILAASGFTIFWRRQTRKSFQVAAVTLFVGIVALLAIDLVLGLPPVAGLETTLFWVTLVGVVAMVFSRRFARLEWPIVTVVVLLAETPLLWLVRSRGRDDSGSHFAVPNVLAAVAIVLVASGVLVALVGGRMSSRDGLAAAVVAGFLLFGVLNTPLDWFPSLAGRAIAGHPLYDQQYRGLTAGLYRGLLWLRENTDPDDVLAVNNHSLHPDNSDSKYFYYSAFAQRRVALESWDYTAQAVATGLFSVDSNHTPFFRRLTLANLAFGVTDESAIHSLARDYQVKYLVVDKVHRAAAPALGNVTRHVFGDGDIDVYEIPRGAVRGTQSICSSDEGAGISAVFGQRRTLDEAVTLRDRAHADGFQGLTIERRGCADYAVVMSGLPSLADAKAVQAAAAAFNVRLECRSQAPAGGVNAVFGHRRTRREALRLAARATAFGFRGLDVQQDACNDWEVDLKGLRTAAQRRDFRSEAASVGFHIVFEPG
jgi:hypothetical protein